MKIHERYLWALQMLDINPTDVLLEIGCGTGILTELVAGNLSAGTITALDRPAAMIKKTAARNHTFIKNGIVHCITGSLASASLPGHYYKKFLPST